MKKHYRIFSVIAILGLAIGSAGCGDDDHESLAPGITKVNVRAIEVTAYIFKNGKPYKNLTDFTVNTVNFKPSGSNRQPGGRYLNTNNGVEGAKVATAFSATPQASGLVFYNSPINGSYSVETDASGNIVSVDPLAQAIATSIASSNDTDGTFLWGPATGVEVATDPNSGLYKFKATFNLEAKTEEEMEVFMEASILPNMLRKRHIMPAERAVNGNRSNPRSAPSTHDSQATSSQMAI